MEYFKSIVQVSQKLKLILKLRYSKSITGQTEKNAHYKSVIKHVLHIIMKILSMQLNNF